MGDIKAHGPLPKASQISKKMASQKESTVTLRIEHIGLLLFIFGIVLGAFGGYYFGIQNSFGLQGGSQTTLSGESGESGGDLPDGSGSQGITITRAELFLKYASDLKLDTTKFESCLKDEKYKEQVNSDYSTAVQIGSTGTPTFIVNGQLVPIGAAPYESFKDILDLELKNSTDRKC